MTNKYNGINDYPNCDKRIYRLWYGIHRRCYDISQFKRSKGRSYADCTVCDRWHSLSSFAEDITRLDGYGKWVSGENMVLDKDLRIAGNKEYSPDACCFISSHDNLKEMNSRHPDITKVANEHNKTRYAITRIFNSEKEAAEYLGVRQCSVASCYRKGAKCKGFTVDKLSAKMDMEEEE